MGRQERGQAAREMLLPRKEGALAGPAAAQDTVCLYTPVSGCRARGGARFLLHSCEMECDEAGRAAPPLKNLRLGMSSTPPRREGGVVDKFYACPWLTVQSAPQ